MFTHYIKIAGRQFLKYKTQSVLSVLSLAIGFTCFALAELWIHYETTYDSFHKDSDRLFCLMIHNTLKGSNNNKTYAPAGDFLHKHLPEIEAATTFKEIINTLFIKNIEYNNLYGIKCDSTFLNLFNIEILHGSKSFLFNKNEIAITDELAHKAWGNQSPIGETIKIPNTSTKYTITAVVKGWSQHSNFPFDYLLGGQSHKKWHDTGWTNLLRISSEVDKKSFMQKMDTFIIRGVEYGDKTDLYTVPLTRLRHAYSVGNDNIQLTHIYLFALAGGLLILCALLNYLTLFINRIFIRKQEIALRMVYGSSGIRILKLLFTEFVLLLISALFIGMLLIELVLPYFKEMTNISSHISDIYIETFLYSIISIFVAFLLSVTPIYYFRKQTLNTSINAKNNKQLSYGSFRKLTVGVQLAVSLFFILCTTVLMKQINDLRHSDLGFERKNIAYIIPRKADISALNNYLYQIPEITSILSENIGLFPQKSIMGLGVYPGECKNDDDDDDSDEIDITQLLNKPMCLVIKGGENYLKFYGIKLLEGEWLRPESGDDKALINESTARRLGWDKPIGQRLSTAADKTYTIIGVVKDFQNISPTTPTNLYLFANDLGISLGEKNIIFKYRPDTWLQCKEKIEKYFKDNNEETQFELFNSEEEYNKMLKSEDVLQTLLSIISAVCIIISMFGIYSMILLTCEQRRKEIAIRKVNGATVANILYQFFREYIILLLVAAAIAFPIGYACMKPWLEKYIIQTEINWWIYPTIFIGIASLVFLCIGWRVWRTANNNPAEEVRKE